MVRCHAGDYACPVITGEEVRMELSMATRTERGYAVLEVAGEIDVYTAPQLRERLIALVEGGATQVVVDLGRVEFLDSTGLGVLVGALKRLRVVGGELLLVCAQERLLKIFRITGLDRVFALHDSVEAATSGDAGDHAGTAG
jgi:anti-sigma B factor antagonist